MRALARPHAYTLIQIPPINVDISLDGWSIGETVWISVVAHPATPLPHLVPRSSTSRQENKFVDREFNC